MRQALAAGNDDDSGAGYEEGLRDESDSATLKWRNLAAKLPSSDSRFYRCIEQATGNGRQLNREEMKNIMQQQYDVERQVRACKRLPLRAAIGTLTSRVCLIAGLAGTY